MILIADNNKAVRQMIRGLIEELDPEIIECSDGQSAIDSYEEHQPGLVLMDFNMLPVDGLTASREILSRDSEAKILIISQHQEPGIRKASIEAGARGFVGKDDLTLLPELIEELRYKDKMAEGASR